MPFSDVVILENPQGKIIPWPANATVKVLTDSHAQTMGRRFLLLTQDGDQGISIPAGAQLKIGSFIYGVATAFDIKEKVTFQFPLTVNFNPTPTVRLSILTLTPSIKAQPNLQPMLDYGEACYGIPWTITRLFNSSNTARTTQNTNGWGEVSDTADRTNSFAGVNYAEFDTEKNYWIGHSAWIPQGIVSCTIPNDPQSGKVISAGMFESDIPFLSEIPKDSIVTRVEGTVVETWADFQGDETAQTVIEANGEAQIQTRQTGQWLLRRRDAALDIAPGHNIVTATGESYQVDSIDRNPRRRSVLLTASREIGA